MNNGGFTSSAFGAAQKLIYVAAGGFGPVPADLEHRACELLGIAFEASRLVHEGAATFVQHVCISEKYSRREADEYVARKPALYREGFQLFYSLVNRFNLPPLSQSTIAMLAGEAVLHTSILGLSDRLLSMSSHEFAQEVDREHPNRRLRTLISELTPDTTRLIHVEVADSIAHLKEDEIPIELVDHLEWHPRHVAAAASFVKALGRHCLPVCGSEDYPDAFHRARSRAADDFNEAARNLGLDGYFRVGVNPPPADVAGEIAWVAEREAEVTFVATETPTLEIARRGMSVTAVMEKVAAIRRVFDSSPMVYLHAGLPVALKRGVQPAPAALARLAAQRTIVLRSYERTER